MPNRLSRSVVFLTLRQPSVRRNAGPYKELNRPAVLPCCATCGSSCHMSDETPLRAISLFDGLTDAELSAVAASCTIRTFEKQAQILGEQEPTTDVFFILSGTVRSTSYTAAGREVIFNETEAGEIFGEFSAVDGLPLLFVESSR